jgi:hypothetical protein
MVRRWIVAGEHASFARRAVAVIVWRVWRGRSLVASVHWGEGSLTKSRICLDTESLDFHS